MKNLSKLILPLAFSSVLNAQNLLPERFKDYEKIPSDSKIVYLEGIGKFIELKCYSIDKDSLYDVVESYSIDITDGKKIVSNHPFGYFFEIDGEWKYLIDTHMDGLNGNEYFEKPKKQIRL